MNRKLLVLSILPAFLLLGTIHDTRTPAIAGGTVATTSAQGLVLNLDPNTGAILDHPTASATRLAVAPELANAMSTSDDGLVELPNPSGGKGMYANLEGRFQSAMVGTTVDGKLVTPCAQGLNTAANTASQK